MGRYTTEIRNVIRVAETQAHGSYTEFEYTDATWRALGLDSYPIYEESHRAKLNSMICDHFYMREIGAETVALFRLFVRRTMNEIMPYYNELYRSLDLDYDILSEIEVTHNELWGEDSSRTWDDKTDMTRTRVSTVSDDRTTDTTQDSTTKVTGSTTTNVTGSTTTDTSSASSNMFSDTPMSMVQDDGGTLLESGNYATTATFDRAETDQTGTSTSDQTGTSTSDQTGKVESNVTDRATRSEDGHDTDLGTHEGNDDTKRTGSRTSEDRGRRVPAVDLIRRFRENVINVDRMIVESPELNECFMQVY